VQGVLLDYGRQRDSSLASHPTLSWQRSDSDRTTRREAHPQIVKDLDDIYVLAKPPGWEVDARRPGREGTATARKSIVQFLKTHFGHRAPIVFDVFQRHGVLHRLDANSSGLILGALSYSAYLWLNMQLDLAAVEREYVILVHGWLDPEVVIVNARVKRVDGHMSNVAPDGKPAATRIKVVGHYEVSDGVDSEPFGRYSLVLARLITGRSHQIRTHMCHLGHPVVCDAKYNTLSALQSDVRWCKRNFLHRFRLAVDPPSKTEKAEPRMETLQSLPADLVAALRFLKPRCPASQAAQDEWCAGEDLMGSYLKQRRLVVGGAGGLLVEEAHWPPGPLPSSSEGLSWHLATWPSK